MEKEVFIEMLYNREKALAFDFSYLAKVSHDVAPPQVIKTIPHKVWQASGLRVPRALLPIAIDMFQERLKHEVLEHRDSPYRNG